MTNRTEAEVDFEYVRRAFGCGTGFQEFRSAFESLSADNKARLARAAWRMWLTLMLRYRLNVFSHEVFQASDEFWRSRNEWHSLELYLLVTCFDTLAGKAKHVPFEQWLEQRHNEGSLELQDVVKLYKEYQDEHGVRRNLKRTFAELPSVAKEWITNVIRYLIDDDWPTPPDELELDVDVQINRVVSRVFEFRNRYTHSSIARAPFVEEHLALTPEKNEWVYTVFPEIDDPRDKPKKRLLLCHRQGIDEASLLRVLLVVVTAKLLGLPISEELIRANVEKSARIDALYRFIYELQANAQLLRGLYSEEKAYWSFLWTGIPSFATERTEVLVDHMWDNPLERGLRKWLREYLEVLQRANQEICEFNETYPPFNDRNVGEFGKEKQSQRNQGIEAFLDRHRQSWKQILEITSSSQAFNIWLIIRNPCYS